MTTFDKREEGFEKKFAHDEELRFKATARRNKMLGMWAAAKLGMTGADADAYAKAIVMADLEEAGDGDVFRKIRKDFDAKSIAESDHPDPPHHGRTDGEGGRRHQGERLTGAMSGLPALSDDEIARWYDDKSFSADWTTWHFANWTEWLHHLRERPVSVLEIGSWEGRSALFFLNFLQASRLVCVDTFGGNVEHHLNPHFAALVPETERTFDHNIAAFAGRIEKLKGPSAAVLPQLGIASRRFDVAYIDGSHRAADVYSDAALCWPMVARRGIVIFDDYEFDQMEEEIERPKLGIDAFLAAIDDQYRLIHKGYQVAIVKL